MGRERTEDRIEDLADEEAGRKVLAMLRPDGFRTADPVFFEPIAEQMRLVRGTPDDHAHVAHPEGSCGRCGGHAGLADPLGDEGPVRFQTPPR